MFSFFPVVVSLWEVVEIKGNTFPKMKTVG